MNRIVKMRDVRFDKSLFVNFRTRTVLDNLLCSYQGLPKGVNYMIIGDPGVGKTTIILDMLANIHAVQPAARILFISAEMNEIDLAVYVERFPKFSDLDILFVECGFDEDAHTWQLVSDTLNEGWDIVAIDSFYELQGIVKEEENVTNKRAESMLLSLIIFVTCRRKFPTPAKKQKQEAENYTAEERQAMAKEIKQRLYALFAVLGIVIFFWLSFHQNGQSLSLFARDFVVTESIAPEIWQAVNPFFVITLTPLIMLLFGTLARRGKEISTPKKIAIGMGITGVAFLFLTIYSAVQGYPSGTDFKAMADSAKAGLKAGPWVLIVTYFFLTVAELFISPLGLSFVSKVAPKHIQGLCQGLWLGATAIGNLFLWVGPLMYNKMPIWQCWTVFFVICLVSMGVMLGMVKWLERVTK